MDLKEEQQALWGTKSLKNHCGAKTGRQNVADTFKDEADVSHSPYIIVLVDYSVAHHHSTV